MTAGTTGCRSLIKVRVFTLPSKPHFLAVQTHLLDQQPGEAQPPAALRWHFILFHIKIMTLQRTATIWAHVLTSIAGLLESGGLFMVHLASFPLLSALEITSNFELTQQQRQSAAPERNYKQNYSTGYLGEINGEKWGYLSRDRSWKRCQLEQPFAMVRWAAHWRASAASLALSRPSARPGVWAHIGATCWWLMRCSSPQMWEQSLKCFFSLIFVLKKNKKSPVTIHMHKWRCIAVELVISHSQVFFLNTCINENIQ